MSDKKNIENKDIGNPLDEWAIADFLRSRVWLYSEALEWIRDHSEEIHQNALVSCSEYPPVVELGIFDAGYQKFIDKKEVGK